MLKGMLCWGEHYELERVPILHTYLAHIGVQLSKGVAKFLHILGKQLVGIGDPVVQVSHLVERESPKEAKRKEKSSLRAL